MWVVTIGHAREPLWGEVSLFRERMIGGAPARPRQLQPLSQLINHQLTLRGASSTAVHSNNTVDCKLLAQLYVQLQRSLQNPFSTVRSEGNHRQVKE